MTNALFNIKRNCGSALKSALAHETVVEILNGNLEKFEQGKDVHLPSEDSTVKSKFFCIIFLNLFQKYCQNLLFKANYCSRHAPKTVHASSQPCV